MGTQHLGSLIITLSALLAFLLLAACSSSPSQAPTTTQTVTVSTSSTVPAPSFLSIASSAFVQGGKIPLKYTQQGDNVSPPLSWNLTPAGTQSFALITEDIDGPSGIITHWIIFNLPSNLHELAEAVPVQDQLSNGAKQGNNVRGQRGYIGPSPPAGTVHRYEFTLFALDAALGLEPGGSRADLITNIQSHILAVAQTLGIYQRQ